MEEMKQISLIAYEFLKSFNSDDYADGRYELKDGHYVNIETYETKNRNGRKFESHERFIDIQYMISGEELIAVAPTNELRVCDPYSLEKDITFYEDSLSGEVYHLESEHFLIFKPGEGHMPCICVNEKQKVRKAVIKVPVREGRENETD